MSRIVVVTVLVLSLCCTWLTVAGTAGTSASAARGVGGVPTLQAPVQVREGVVRLAGRVRAARRVVLQRRVHGRWSHVRRVRVRDHRFVTRVRARSRAQRVRVVAGGRRSQVRVVRPFAASPARPTARPPADACGVRPAKADGSWWSCTLAEDFDGTALDREVWTPQTVFATGERLGRHACYRDHADNVAVSDGALHLTVREEAIPVGCLLREWGPTPYSAGMVTTYHRFSQRYGRFEARIRSTATSAPGLQEAFWLWPDDRQDIPVLWPEAGEIDISETYSHYPELSIPFLHYTANDNGGPVPGLNTAWNCRAVRGVYTTYTLEWTADRIAIHVDGRPCLVNTSGDPAFDRAYIISLTQALGVGRNAHTGGAPLPATMDVDYVRVWE